MRPLKKEKQAFTRSLNKIRMTKMVLLMETIHIPLWLFKDTCWLMEYKTFGVLMAIPTILVAIFMVIATYRDAQRFLPNLSILFWILANTNWMLDEFYYLGSKNYSLIPFLCGVFVFLIFVLTKLIKKGRITAI